MIAKVAKCQFRETGELAACSLQLCRASKDQPESCQGDPREMFSSLKARPFWGTQRTIRILSYTVVARLFSSARCRTSISKKCVDKHRNILCDKWDVGHQWTIDGQHALPSALATWTQAISFLTDQLIVCKSSRVQKWKPCTIHHYAITTDQKIRK